jgi:hypothetical protein
MFFSDIDELPEFEILVIIININTRLSTTLAILSADRFTEFPILLIDCSNNIQELNYFEKLFNIITPPSPAPKH